MKLTKYERMFLKQVGLDIKASGVKPEELTETRFMDFVKARYERNNKLATFILNNPEAQARAKKKLGSIVYGKIRNEPY